MHTVAETPMFSRQAHKLFSDEERRELIDHLADHPAAGDEIPGTDRGKRGGARVIYFYGGEDMPVYALLAYAKSARTDMNPAERRSAAGIVAAIRRARKERQ